MQQFSTHSISLVCRFIFYRWVLLNKQWMTLSGDGNQIGEWTRWQLSEAYQKVSMCFVGKCVVIPMLKFIESICQSHTEWRAKGIVKKTHSERKTKKKNKKNIPDWKASSVSAGVCKHEMMMQMNGCKIYASPRNTIKQKTP